jgi:D-3-phosphoglycerate dehydrogenase / 2-oxoglutarate reductase
MHQAFVDVLAAHPLMDVELIRLSEDEASIRSKLAACQGYYARASRDELPKRWHVHAELLADLPQLMLVASYGAGYDTIDVSACTQSGVGVVNQAGGNAEGVAEHAVGMMLTLLKRIPEAAAAMRGGTVQRREAFMGRELAHRTVGIIGLGHIGRRVAEIVRTAFGCHVLAYDPYVDALECNVRGAERCSLGRLLVESDIVTVHCPLTAETRYLLGAEQFAAMKPGAIFINTARGSIHDESALHDALSTGRLHGAGLDVWEREPPLASHPLLAHPAVLVSPHTAGVTQESRERVATMAAGAFIDAAEGRLPGRLVNPEVGRALLERLRRCGY